jgi:hypothetical protein
LAATAGSCIAIFSAGALDGCASTSANSDTTDSDQASPSSKASSAQDSSLEALSVSSDAVFTTEDCTYLDTYDTSLALTASITLPFGSIIHAASGNTGCALLPGDTGNPLLQVATLNLQNGTTTTILEGAQGASEGYQIFDARANEQGIIWLEADILEDAWRIYTAKIQNSAAANIQLVASYNSDWEMPSLAIGGNYGFWQTQPNSDGGCANSDSVIMSAKLSATTPDVQVVYSSPGKFACEPSPTKQGIVIAPRMDTTSTQYKLVHIEADTFDQLDVMALPTSMKPYCIGYGTSGFSFGFSAIYESTSGIANLGTYTPALSRATDFDSGTEWFRFPRTPICAPAWCGNLFFVKSTTVVAGINFVDKSYFSIDAEGEGESYGEYLASSGTVDQLVTFSNLNYTPISGDAIKECRVSIWTAK